MAEEFRSEERSSSSCSQRSSSSAKGDAMERRQPPQQGGEEGLQVLGQSMGMEQQQGSQGMAEEFRSEERSSKGSGRRQQGCSEGRGGELVMVLDGVGGRRRWWRRSGWMAGWHTATPAWPRRRPVVKEG